MTIHSLLPILGQIVSIGAMIWCAVFVHQQRLEMYKHSNIYSFKFSLRAWVLSWFVHKPEYRKPLNKMLENQVYLGYVIFFWTSIGLTFGLLHQLSTNQVYQKSAWFFVSSPLNRISLVFILVGMAEALAKYKKENRILRLENNRLKDLKAH